MKLWEFILDAGNSISLRHDLPGHLCCGTLEIWACEHWILPMPSLFGFNATTTERTLPRGRAWRFSRRYAHTTSNISSFRQILNGLSWDRRLYLVLVHVPPPSEFDPFIEVEDLDEDQGSAPTQVSILDYNDVSQLHEAARLKLALARLSDEHVSNRTRWHVKRGNAPRSALGGPEALPRRFHHETRSDPENVKMVKRVHYLTHRQLVRKLE
ncbi:hypothetical protein JCGZ_03843 [Jatropha curcas]|uniref:Uncharacterized protein n=1 Tax=Jatropha curcas TaxID=180498 RepID=A0A067KZL7_JATCU|nr:hypothetical protein JCGZ_03843 [Jatropha curcas]